MGGVVDLVNLRTAIGYAQVKIEGIHGEFAFRAHLFAVHWPVAAPLEECIGQGFRGGGVGGGVRRRSRSSPISHRKQDEERISYRARKEGRF